jgi:magnesium chelatase family protein
MPRHQSPRIDSELPKSLIPIYGPAACVVRAAGSLLLVGESSSGGTLLARMLARSSTTLLGSATTPQVAGIYRMAGLQWDGNLPPFRAPHHTVSLQGMSGVGHQFRPGELALAHGGLLFLDEAAEFAPSVLRLTAACHREGMIEYGGRPPRYLEALPTSFALIVTCRPDTHVDRLHGLFDFDKVIELPKIVW